ncbi:MAG: hypothetical protein HW421_2907 [Ignavibacteria bacterium]|nr:hypothetical protein [Ignavibacteria bacterium]
MEQSKINIHALRDAVVSSRIVWRKHALERMLEQDITIEKGINCIIDGEVIRVYLEDRPYPSALFLRIDDFLPLHVIASYNDKAQITYIITAYNPSTEYYYDDFKTRKK